MTTLTTHTTPPPGPYSAAAATYWSHGWRGLLPLPAGAKTPVPQGFTGATGSDPSWPDVQTWTDGPEAAGNIALRLPPHIIGIDVDAYDNKPARLVLAELERTHGPLPPTWRTTSRDDGTSGIRLYQAPPGLRWPGGLGPGIDLIRHGHRYAVVWPSTHPNGGTYRWITPDGATTLEQVPDIDDLPHLPDTWVTHFTGGELETEQPRADLDHGTANTWLTEHGQGHPCARQDRALTDAINALPTATSRHDAVLAATNRIIWLTAEHHPGALTVLPQLRTAFLAATTGDRQPGDAEHEWDRMIIGAVRLAAARQLPDGPDPCDDPFSGLIPKEQPRTPAPATSVPAQAPTDQAAPANTAQAPGDATATGAADPPERSSWWPENLDNAIDGEPEPPPAHLTRSDGHSAFYAGRVNGIIGPSESGKTWVALHAIRQALDHGEHVTFLDFEDSAKGVAGRLLNLGVTPDTLRERFAYISPTQMYSMFAQTGLDLAEHLNDHHPSLIVLDGFNASMSLQGLNLLDNMDATRFFQTILNPLVETGATVVYIDHTPKNSGDNPSAGGIGAQAKRAMTRGCALKVEVIKHFAKGKPGKLRTWIDKDRQGDVRATSVSGKGGDWFGDFNVDGNPDGTLTVALDPPEGLDVDSGNYTFRPTGYMERVSRWLEQNPAAGMNEIKAGVGGKAPHVVAAIRVLVDEGSIEVTTGARRKQSHTVVTPYRDSSDLTNGTESPLSPTESRDPVKTTGSTGSHWVTKDPVDPGTSQSTITDPPRPHDQDPTNVERTIGGRRVNVNLHTGEVTDL